MKDTEQFFLLLAEEWYKESVSICFKESPNPNILKEFKRVGIIGFLEGARAALWAVEQGVLQPLSIAENEHN
jgi:hypothetical protein